MTESDPTTYRYSGQTPHKQESYQYLIERELAMIGAIRKKHDWARLHHPLFLDLYAGPGKDPNGCAGSPIILLQAADKQDYTIEAHFYESDRMSLQNLIYNLAVHNDNRNYFVIHPVDNQSVLDLLPKRRNSARLGMAYADPSNGDLLNAFTLLCKIGQIYRKVDLVINYAAATWKRRHAFEYYKNLIAILPDAGKQKWLIREPLGKHQWTMLLGTNYLEYKPEENRRWHDIRTEPGRTYFLRAALTKDELNSSSQLSLFGEDEDGNS